MEQTNTQQAAENLQAHYQEFLNFLENTGRSIFKKMLDAKQGVQITKGNRNKVIYGQTLKGLRNDLSSKDVATLQNLIKEQPVAREGTSHLSTNYEIKFGGEILFRQESDGAVTVNQASQLGFVRQLNPGVTTLEDYQNAFNSEPEQSSEQERGDKESSASVETEVAAETGTYLEPEASLEEEDLTERPPPAEEREDFLSGEADFYGNDEEEEISWEEVVATAEENSPEFDAKTGVNSEKEQSNVAAEELLHRDTDRDGFTDAEEIAYGTNPLSGDTDQDGYSDQQEVQERFDPVHSSWSENNLLEGQNQAQENLLEREDALGATRAVEGREATLESNATACVTRQIERLRDITVKEALSTLVTKTAESIQSGVKLTLETLNPYSQKNQEIKAAQTTLKLLENNFQQTGETEYKAVDYEVKQRGFNQYQVTDQEGNLKLSFERDGSQIKITESQLEGKDYQTFAAAAQNLKSAQKTALEGKLEERINHLYGLAKEQDRQQYLALKGREVLETAADFLHYAGAKFWEREGSNYRIQSDKKTFLTIEAKDGRGIILNYSQGKMQQNLSSQDLQYFKELGKNTQELVAQKQQQQDFSVQVKSKRHTINKEKELSL